MFSVYIKNHLRRHNFLSYSTIDLDNNEKITIVYPTVKCMSYTQE